jgi:hypothetical protein
VVEDFVGGSFNELRGNAVPGGLANDVVPGTCS